MNDLIVTPLNSGTFNLIREQEAFRAKFAKFEDKLVALGLELFEIEGEDGERADCPHCGINLDNGIAHYEDIRDSNKAEAAKMKHEWMCLGCGEEFGPAVKGKGSSGHANRGIRSDFSSIEKPTKKVWNIAEGMKGAKRADVIAACVAQGIAYNTARTQYQQWSQACRGIIK